MKSRYTILLTAVFAVALMVEGCGNGTHLTGIQIYPVTPVATIGSEVQFSITGFYSNATQQTITASQGNWSSSNTAIATVNAGGTAAALAQGATTITVTASGKTSTTILLVTQ